MADISLLKTFLAVYRAESITAASRVVGLTQPAVSGHLKSLEVVVGRPLFIRLARGVSPTPAGHALARSVAPHLDAMKAVFATAKLTARGDKGRVFLGGPVEFSTERLTPVVAELPLDSVEVRLRYGLAAELNEALAVGELDLAVSTVAVQISGVEATPLCDERFVLVGNGSWAAKLHSASIERGGASALDGAPLIAYDEKGSILRRYWRLVFAQRLERQIAVVAPDLRSVREFVERGCGISVLPWYLCAKAVADGALQILFEPKAQPHNTLHLAWRSDRMRATAVALVRQRILTAARNWSP